MLENKYLFKNQILSNKSWQAQKINWQDYINKKVNFSKKLMKEIRIEKLNVVGVMIIKK